ncbi:S-layer homology domain-containing protein, partial [Paenibacillus qinlingensis]
ISATVKVNGTAVASGAASEAISLSVGSNTITTIVTAEDGTTTKTYTVTVTRAAAALSNNADLSGLGLSSGTLSPVFASGTTSYTASVANGVSSITVTPTVSDISATVKVNGTAVASGAASEAISLSVGSNTITVVATAQDGTTTKTYTVTVSRAAQEESGVSGQSPTPASPNDDKVTSMEGKLTLPTGKTGEVRLGDAIKIDIPANATDKELKLTIEKVLDTPDLLTKQEVLASPIFEILKNFSGNFSKPVTLTFSFDLNSLKDNQKAVVFYYDEVKKEWVEVGGKVDGDHIIVDVNHFTKYAVFVVDIAAAVPTGDTKPTINFNDISEHWAEASVKQAVSIGIVTGYPDGTFKPGSTVSRAEFAVMLMNALKPQEAGAELTFTDTAKIGAWAQKAIAQAVKAGVIKGYEDGSFRPDEEITRAEMVAMIANALSLTVESNIATGFADDKDIPAWTRGAVAAVKQLGLVEGKGANEFDANGKTTRAEAVTVLLKMLAQKSK